MVGAGTRSLSIAEPPTGAVDKAKTGRVATYDSNMNTQNSLIRTPSPASTPDTAATDSGRFWSECRDQICHEVLESACAAPSADNNQPWLFQASDSGIEVFYDLPRRLPSDVDGMFDLLSLGAVIENITLQLAAMGIGSTLELEIESSGSDRLRRIGRIAVNSNTAPDAEASLAESIFARRTTRLPYSRQLDAGLLDQIQTAAIRDSSAQLAWETDRGRINRLARVVAISDSLRFRYREFHEELHRQLRLSPEESERTRDGLDYRTLGLPPGGRFVLQLLRPWRRMAALNRVGLATAMSLPTIRLVRASGAIGFLSIPDRSPESMITGGRAMQRIWLKATELGLSLHPLGSLPIFLAHPSLPDQLKPIGAKIRSQAADLLPDQRGILQMAFRIGHCNADPGVKSLRRPVEEVLRAKPQSTPESPSLREGRA